MADQLVSAPQNLTSPRSVKATDFKVKTPAAGSGMQGNDQLVSQSLMECCPGGVTGSDFTVGQSSSESGKSLSLGDSVDFGTGMHSSPDQKR